MKKKWLNMKTIILIIGVLIILGLLIWKFKAWNYLSIKYLKKFTSDLRGLGYLGVILYVVGFMLATLICIPSLPIVLLGGLTYGTIRGVIYASLGDIGGAILAFIIARYLMRERVEKKLQSYKTFHEIDEGVKHQGWRIVVLTRMVPVIPQWLQNYAYGLTSISMTTYGLVSFLCIVPPIAVWIFAINKVGRGGADPKKTMIYLTVAAVVFIGISYLPKLIFKKDKLLKKK